MGSAARQGLSLLAALILASGEAGAAGGLGPEGAPIGTSAFGIDFFEGPVLSSCRVSGLAGAYAGLAEGVEGDAVNPAAPALRLPWSFDWFDYDFTVGLTSAGALSSTDFDNDGRTGFARSDFLFGTLGVNLQLGPWGAGATVDTREYKGLGEALDARATLTRAHLVAARSFASGAWTAGVGARGAALQVNQLVDGKRTRLFSTSGAGLEAGLLWSPPSLPIRAGLAVRQSVASRPEPGGPIAPDAGGDRVLAGTFLPERVVLPWEVEVGVALLAWGGALNVSWVNPRDARDEAEARARREELERLKAQGTSGRVLDDAWRRAVELKGDEAAARHRAEREALHRAAPRRRLGVSASLTVTGAVADAVGVDAFFRQAVQRSGARLSLTPRLGIELEPIDDRLQIRAGFYLEPSRFETGSPRPHGTAGLDVKLFSWTVFGLLSDDTVWSAGGFADLSRRYSGTGVRVGFWH